MFISGAKSASWRWEERATFTRIWLLQSRQVSRIENATFPRAFQNKTHFAFTQNDFGLAGLAAAITNEEEIPKEILLWTY